MNTELDKVTADSLREISDLAIDKTQIAAAEKALPELLTRAAANAKRGKRTVGLYGKTRETIGDHGYQWLVEEMEKRGFTTHCRRQPFSRFTSTWWGW